MSTDQESRLTATQWLVLIAAFLGWMFDGLEMGLFPLAARPALRDLMHLPTEGAVAQWYSYLVALFLVGAAAGGLVFGWLGDKIGRVRSMALSILAYAGFTGCCALATEPWHLAAFRFLAALGMGGEWALGVALVMECWPEKLRPILAGVIGAAANFGFLSISVLGIVAEVTETQWRWFMVAGAAPALLAIFVIAFIPESQRWQASVSKAASKPLKEIFTTRLLKPTLLGIALASVAFIGTWGAVSAFLPVWTDQLVGGERVLRLAVTLDEEAADDLAATLDALRDPVAVRLEAGGQAARIAGKDEEGLRLRKEISRDLTSKDADGEPVGPARYEVATILTNVGTRSADDVALADRLPLGRIEPASVKVVVNKEQLEPSDESSPGELTWTLKEAATPDGSEVTVRYDPSTGELAWRIGDLEYKDPRAKAWAQCLLSIGAIIGCFLGPMMGRSLGRRPAYFLLCLVSLVTCQYLFRFLGEFDWLFITTVGVVGLATASFYGWLPLYLPELFPTRVRATGQGIAFNSGRILAAAGALTTGELVGLFGGYPQACATITFVYVIGMLLIWVCPETKGKPLPE